MTGKGKTRFALVKTYLERFGLICSVAAIVCMTIVIYPDLDGWFYYRTGWEIATALARLTVMSILIGIALGVGVTVLLTLLTLHMNEVARMRRFWRRGDQLLIGSLALIAAGFFLRNLMSWLLVINIGLPTAKYQHHLLVLFFLAGGLAILFRRRRLPPLLTRFFASGISRRNVITLGGVAAAISATEHALSSFAAPIPVSRSAAGGNAQPNILLVVFDALSAGDMSGYGYRLPTTPHIDRFAQTATTFRHFYACSTFTTPSVVGLSCGRYPSNTRVFQLNGALHGDDRAKTLPFVLRAAGYETGASVANTAAHPDVTRVSGYAIAPSPPISDVFIRASFKIGEPSLAYDAWSLMGRVDGIEQRMIKLAAPSVDVRAYPPQESFAQAALLWKKLRGPRFLHVHVMAPHTPYQPSPAFRGRFFDKRQQLYRQLPNFVWLWTGTYKPQSQPYFDRLRLRYDEWIAEADAAFGAFVADLEASGELANTIVAVTADHGESFEGNIFGHGGPSQLRSMIHVPLIVRKPGQTWRTEVRVAVDAVSLAPTLLDLADIPVPRWMDGVSLRRVMDQPQTADQGYAFTQFFERNSVFEPITRGTVGVIDGRRQYVVELETGKGRLYDLAGAHLQNNEISSGEPENAGALRERIRARFSALPISA